jgi:hypothetical protein
MRELSNWPPMPIQTSEYVSLRETVTVGMIQDALMFLITGAGFIESEKTTYPLQSELDMYSRIGGLKKACARNTITKDEPKSIEIHRMTMNLRRIGCRFGSSLKPACSIKTSKKLKSKLKHSLQCLLVLFLAMFPPEIFL